MSTLELVVVAIVTVTASLLAVWHRAGAHALLVSVVLAGAGVAAILFLNLTSAH